MIYHIYFDKGNRSTTLYIFKNEKEVVCLHEKNCQSNSSNSDEDLSIISNIKSNTNKHILLVTLIMC